MKFVVYEVWTTAKVVEAPSIDDAYDANEPKCVPGDLTLSNWHVVPLDPATTEPPDATGGLNYRQVK